MTIEHATHLSEEAMNDVLIGLETPEASAHLGACPVCRERLNEFQADMLLFNQTSLAWSEARSATMTRPERKRVRWAEFVPAAWAAAAAILLLMTIPVWWHRNSPAAHETSDATAAAPVAANQSEDSEAQIAADNDLMRSVDVALSNNDEAPIAEYYLSDRPHPRAKVRPELRTQ